MPKQLGKGKKAGRITYPATRRNNVVEERFGTTVADPYWWLESDAQRTPDVATWITAQDRTARTYLATLPGRETFRERLTALFDHERLTIPHGPDRVLIDPNGWSQDGAAALAEWSPSEDGKHLAFAVRTAARTGERSGCSMSRRLDDLPTRESITRAVLRSIGALPV